MVKREGLTTKEEIEKMRRELDAALAQTTNTQVKPKWKKRLSLGVFLVLVVFLTTILGSVLLAKSRGETPSVFGYQLYSVETASMDPTLPVGSMFLARKPENPAALPLGQIVTFRTLKGETVTHRIIEVISTANGSKYITKGDNPINTADSDPLTPDRVIAVFVFRIPLT